MKVSKATQKDIDVTLNNYINLKLPNLRAAIDAARVSELEAT